MGGGGFCVFVCCCVWCGRFGWIGLLFGCCLRLGLFGLVFGLVGLGCGFVGFDCFDCFGFGFCLLLVCWLVVF